ncbi:MAG: hypothetical protein GXP62_07800 [Oligoflexia bacterium]|nr:hypothetical protein [Oligoflexia bacterium]
MLWLLLACSPAAPTDTGSTSASEWEERVLYQAAPGWVVGAEDALLAVAGNGMLVDIAAGWTQQQSEGSGWLSEVVAGQDGLWAVGQNGLGHFVDGWEFTALPDTPDSYVVWDLSLDGEGRQIMLGTINTYEYGTGGVGAENDLLSWNGTDWTIAESFTLDQHLEALASTGGGQIIAVGWGGTVATWTDGDWSPVETGTTAMLNDVVVDGDALVVVGQDGTVLRGSPDALVLESVGDEDLVTAAVGTDGSTWVLGATKVWLDDGSGWQALALPQGDWADLATSADGVVVVGKDLGPVGLVGDAGGLTEAWRLDSVDAPSSCWVDPDGTIWLTSTGGMVGRWKNDVLEVEQLDVWDTYFDVLVGASAQDVLLAGYETLWSYDGSAWTQQDVLVENDSVLDAAVADDGTAVAVGYHVGSDETFTGAWWRRVDGNWTADPLPLPEGSRELAKVLLFSPDDIIAVDDTQNDGYRLLHFDGDAWTVLDALAGVELFTAWGRSDDDLWLLGRDDGTLLQHWDGSTLSTIDNVPGDLRQIMGSDGNLLAAGYDRSISDDNYNSAWQYVDGVWSLVVHSDGAVRGCAGDSAWALYDGVHGWRRR